MQTDQISRAATTPRRQRTAMEKRAILEAAQAIFLTERYEAITSAEIARRAGVEEVMPARYFGGKLALLIRIGEEMAEHVLAELAPPPRRGLAADRVFNMVAADLFAVLSGPTSHRLHQLFAAQAGKVQRLEERWRQRLVAAVAARLSDEPATVEEEAATLLYGLFLTYLAAHPGAAPPTAREIGHWAEASSAMLIRHRANARGHALRP